MKRKKAIFIRFVIAEGDQTRVADLRIEGNKALSQEELLSVIASSPGQPFSDFNVATDRANVLALYLMKAFRSLVRIRNYAATGSPAADQSTLEPPSLQDKSAETRADKKSLPSRRIGAPAVSHP